MKITPSYVIDSGELIGVARDLGYDWNEACNDIHRIDELYGQDGSGSVNLSREMADKELYGYTEITRRTIEKLFADNPDADSITVIDDF